MGQSRQQKQHEEKKVLTLQLTKLRWNSDLLHLEYVSVFKLRFELLIICLRAAEDEVCGGKIGDENPKDCCPPGAPDLLIATFLR